MRRGRIAAPFLLALTAGTRLGPYDIVAPIGAGGMGEVYRARDTKLNRDVAIKTLPDAFAADSERLGRFEREARTLASLNHPHIAQIYGFEESGGARALVMELVEGPTLAERLGRGPLLLDEALAIARQIADGLEAAHELGIVHRDLKPANIKVRDDGTVKILDFGLAKALDPTASSTNAAMHSPTLTAHATVVGVILGTAAYMAPEQARGKTVDRRADIWAFGAVLYEMITGKRAFEGEEISDTLASVLKQDPDWTALPSDLPSSIPRVLRRCLEKDPRKRLSAIGDARLDLDERDEFRRVEPPERATPARTRWILPTVVVSAAAGAIAAWLAWAPPSPAPALLSRFSVAPPENVTFYPDSTSAVISPDGRLIALATGDAVGSTATGDFTSLWVRPLDSFKARALAGTEGGFIPFWSPDSRQIAFFTVDHKLKKVTLETGRVEEICDAADGRGGTWNRKGIIVFAANTAGPLLQVAAAGGTPRPVTTLDSARGETGHRFPVFLPDGEHFLYAAVPPRAGAFDIFVGSITPSTHDLLLSAQTTPAISDAGYLLFVRKGSLVAQRFDAKRRTLSGEPVAIGESSAASGFTFLAGPAVSVSTTNALALIERLPNTNLVWLDQAGNQTSRVTLPAGRYQGLNLTRDARRAVLVRWTSPTIADLWIADLDRGGASRLPNKAPGQIVSAVWSPDGERVAFSNNPDGPGDIYLESTLAANGEEPLYRSKGISKQPTSWSTDGRFIIFQDIDPATRWDLWVLSLADRSPKPYAHTASAESGGAISPDGRWVVYESDENNRNEVYVQAFPTPGRKYQVTSEGGSGAWWRSDSRQLLITKETQILLADVEARAEFSTSALRVVGHLPKGVVALDVTTDLKWLLALVNDTTDSGRSITIVQNWTAALR